MPKDRSHGVPASANSLYSRREFVLASAAGVALAPLPFAQAAEGEGGTLRVGLIGCGGRGTGAAAQALAADKNVKLTAMGDAFSDRLETSLKTLTKEVPAAKLDLGPDRCFVGLDAYEKVTAQSDVVVLATPPHFRPIHIKAAVAAGRHIFAEKPVAVDAPGVRAVLAACEEAKRKRLAVVSGLALRYTTGFIETVRRLHAGAIGEIHTLQINDFRGPIWVKPRQPGWTDMEYHLRNWYYFTWLSGDFNVEQHIHMLDVCAWIMKERYPTSAVGSGGRAVRSGPDYGNIYDHHAVVYEYDSGERLFAHCRQMPGTANEIIVHVAGSKGTASLSSRGFQINGPEKWRYRQEGENGFQVEHDTLFGSIRKSEPVNNGEYMSKSTLLAIMGRMATYTGQRVTWDQAMNSQEDLSPSGYTWDAIPPASEVAIPGLTKLV